MPLAHVYAELQDVNDRIRAMAFRYLRAEGFFADLECHEGFVGGGIVACRDRHSFMSQAEFLKSFHKLSLSPHGVFLGAARFSEWCPELPPENALGFAFPTNGIVYEVEATAMRAGFVLRQNGVIDGSTHGLDCGWSKMLGLGLFQLVRLQLDGCARFQRRIQRERWTRGEGTIIVQPSFFLNSVGGMLLSEPRTYGIDADHQLVSRYPMEDVMSFMTDAELLRRDGREFVQREDSDLWQRLVAA